MENSLNKKNQTKQYKMINKKPEYLKIGETYLKFDLEYNEANIQLIKEIIEYQIHDIRQNRKLIKEGVKISIEFEEGSLITRVKIWGTVLFSVYIGIGQYGSFRSGLRDGIKDIRYFSEILAERLEQNPNIDSQNIIRTQKRTGLSGKLKKLLNKIESIQQNSNNLTPNQVNDELNQIKQEISNILEILDYDEQQQFLGDIPNEISENLPIPENKKVNYYMNKYALKPEDEIVFINE